jgi:acetyltransferase
VLAVDRLVELGGIPADISPATRGKLDAVVAPDMVEIEPGRYRGDSDPARYAGGARSVAGRPRQ